MQPQHSARDHQPQHTARDPQPETRLRHGTDSSVIVVSNRQPYRHTKTSDGISVERPTGGLTEGLDPTMCDVGGTWIAWGDGDADRTVVDPNDRVSVPPEDASYTLRRIWLDDDAIDQYYYGMSNQVLWPLCHSFPGHIEYSASDWDRYRQVNEAFANAVVTEATDNSVVWFQDYHLALAPSYVRSRLTNAVTLQQFWHIPWPVWDVFRVVPNSHTLLRGLLGNDRIGFHVHSYCRNFLNCVDTAITEARVDWDTHTVQYQGRTVSVDAIPMGVPVGDIQQEAATPDARSYPEQFRTEHGISTDVRLAIGVDRLDYTKGIPERLDALATFFERYPEWRGTLTYVQNASESRSQIPAYQRVQETVERKVAQINDTFGTDDWEPVVYTTERIPREGLLGLYRAADMALVSPIRDGLNLVALEYVAAQHDTDAALLLSSTAGVHELLGQQAFTIDPHDERQFSATIDTALRVSPEERRRRMRDLQTTVSHNDLQRWIDSQLDIAQPQWIQA